MLQVTLMLQQSGAISKLPGLSFHKIHSLYMAKPTNISCTVIMVIGLALQQTQVMYYSLLLIHSVTYLTSFIFQQIRNNPNTRKNKKTKNKIEKLICLTTRSSDWPLLVQFIFHLKLKEMEARMNYCINTKKITSLVSHPLYDSRSMTWTHHFWI